MKISKLFHWLYCILMLFPFFGAVGIGLVWVFNYGSEVPTVPKKVDREIDFNQLCSNGNFYGTTYWGTINASLNAIPGTQLNVTCYTDQVGNTWFATVHNQGGTWLYEENHLYLVKFYLVAYEYGNVSDLFFEVPQLNYDKFYDMPSYYMEPIEFTFTFDSSVPTVINFQLGAKGALNSNFSVANVQLFDLTRMFGEGSEPSIDTFNQYFPNNYYNTTWSTRMVLENYDTIYVPDNWTNYIWLPSFGGMGATIKSVFTYLIQTMFGISVATGTGGYIVLELLTYWLCISLIWLCFDVIMYVPLLIHRMLDKGVIS